MCQSASMSCWQHCWSACTVLRWLALVCQPACSKPLLFHLPWLHQAEEEDLQDMNVGKAQQQQQQQRRLDSVTDDKSDGDQIHAASSSGHAPPGAFYQLGAAFLRAACSALGLPPKNANTHVRATECMVFDCSRLSLCVCVTETTPAISYSA